MTGRARAGGYMCGSGKAKLWKIISVLALVSILYCGGRSTEETTSADSGITGSGDSATPPVLNAISPANNSTGIARDTSIQLTFGSVVNTATVTMTSGTNCTGSVMVSTDTDFGTDTCIAMNETVTQSGTIITVRPAALLPASTPLYVRVTTAVAGSTGLTMQTQFNSNFTTGTTVAPLSGEFGTDCSGGTDTLTDVRAGGDGDAAVTLTPARSVPNLSVTAIDIDSYFYVQSGASGPAVYVRDATHKASGLGLQVGDVVCITFAERDDYSNFQQVSSITAIKKTSGASSIDAQTVTAAVSDDTYEAETVSVTGTLTTKASSLVGGGYNHTFTYAGGTFTLREMDGSGKLTNLAQGQSIRVVAPMTQFGSGYQLYVDSSVATVTESTSGNFNVSSAATAGSTTVTLTFNNAPTSATATNIANYGANNGLSITGASLSGITVTLTTSAQTVGQSYTITVSNVLRSADNAALTTNTANFTGYAPPASFTTGQVVINEVHIAPSPADEEFVELYNTTASPISLSGAAIWYKSGTGVPGQKTTLTGVIPANGYYTVLRVASPTSYTCSGTLQTSGWGNSGLGNTAGAVVLTVNDTTPTATTDAGVRDIAQWATNTTNWGEGGTTGPAPSTQRTLSRGPNGTDTNNTSNDFVLSPAANGTCGAHNWSADVTAPTIASSVPASAATGIALSSTISVTFSESMYVASVTSANLYLVQGTDCSASSITGTITAATSNTVFSFPSGTLTANTQYSICVKTGVEDLALNNLAADAVRSFTTIAPDVTPPTISSTTPANNAGAVAVGSTIAVTFSEAMSTGTVTAQTATGACTGSVQVSTVADNFATTCIGMTAAAPNFTSGNTVATFTPASALAASTSYHIRVTTAVQDVASNALAAQFTTANGFTTAAADVTAPQVVGASTSPASGATGTSLTPSISVTFNESMATASLTTANFHLVSGTDCNGTAITGTINTGSNPTFTFTAPTLAASTQHTICVKTGVTDSAGNPLAALYSSSFTTGTGGGVNHLVISQVYGAGGNTGATYTHDYVEIFNPTGSAISLNGLSLQYGSSTSTTTMTNVFILPNVSIPAYRYYLVQCSGGANGVALPVTADTTSCSLALAANNGKIVLVNQTTGISSQTALPSATVVDWVGFGTANWYEGSAAAPAPSTTNAIFRAGAGCTDTDQNGTNFTATAANPRFSGTAANACP